MSWVRRRRARRASPGPSVGSSLTTDGGRPAAPVLRATTSDDEVLDDPSEDALFLLFEDMETSDDYVILERLDDPTGEVYLQTTIAKGGGYVVERRAGSAASH